ncbi:MAG: class I SAM-dependent methyltransferase [Gemmatimonadota bacterium]
MTTAPHARRSDEPDHVQRNRAAWERWAPYYRTAGRRAWAEEEPRWGMWGVLESDLGLLKKGEPGMNAIELGCGTAYVCAWLARAGLHPVGVDIAQAQIDNAFAFQREFDLSFRLDRANAEAVPYEDASFDLAISEYGASVWCDPYRWVPEAGRLLRPGGLLVFIVTAPFLMTCTPAAGGSAGERLERPYFGMHRFDFASDDAVEFHLGHGDWFRVLTDNGFTVEDLIEVRPGPHVPPRYNFVSNAWARQWPSEDIWTARRL